MTPVEPICRACSRPIPKRSSWGPKKHAARKFCNAACRDSLRPRIDADYEVMESGCWEWRGPIDANGYGRCTIPGDGTHWAHRASYAHHVGPIPTGLVIDHLCRNPPCINPDHLEPVTPFENTQRGTKARQLYCGKGHPMSGKNLHVSPTTGRRKCKKCNSAASVRWFAKNPIRGTSQAKRPQAMRDKAVAMLASGHTAREAAKALGVHPMTVYRWARADRDLDRARGK